MAGKSQNPDYPDAHPQAPGGMSEPALVVELIETHGYKRADAKALTWPKKIDAVAQARRAAEIEADEAEVYVGTDEDGEDVYEMGKPTQELDGEMVEDEDDFDALMAALDEDIADTEPLCGCGATLSEHGVGYDHAFVDVSLYPDDIQIKLDPLPSTPHRQRKTVALATAYNQGEQPLFIGLPGIKDYIFDGHRGTGPSAAERWMECTASLGASRAFLETLTPNQQVEYAKGSQAARQGTTAHAVAETQARVLLGEVSAEEAELALLELAINPDSGEDYDDEMEGYVAEYTDLVQSYVDEGREVLIESRVTAVIPLLSATDGEQDLHEITGSLDLAVLPSPPIMARNGKVSSTNTVAHQRLVVGDLKYGSGLDVSVESNPQVRIYALGVLALIMEMFDGLPDWLRDVEYIIVQPRLGGIKRWTETVDDLLAWQDDVLSIKLTEALGGQRAGAKFSPSASVCQWCPARGGCPALLELRQEEAAELFDVLIENADEFPETSTLSNADLAKFYTQIRGLTTLADELKAELQRRAYRGDQIPGYYLANYSPPRTWTAEAAEELDPSNREHGILTEENAAKLWQSKLVGPAAAEKLLGEAFAQVERLVIKPEKRPVIAPDGDRRSAWQGKPPEDMFDIETGD